MNDPRDEDTGEVMLQEARPESVFRGMSQELIPPNTQLSPRQVNDLFGSVMVAQSVIKARNIEHLMQKMTVLAAQFGDKYVYSWDVKKKGGGVDTIEGGTVDLAYDLAREYGNNCTDVRALDFPAYIEFYARFTDLETGYTTTRAFRQRKNQTAGGRMDADRQLDITYQIGQSKAIRNVTLKALSSFAEYCIEEAKRGMYDKIKKDPKKYLEAIERGLEKFQIDIKVVELQVSRTKANWTVRDIANVFAKLKSIDEGMAAAHEVFPQELAQTPGPSAKHANAKAERDADKNEERAAVQNDGDENDAAATEDGAVGRSGDGSTSKSPAPDQTPPAKKAEPEPKPKAEPEKTSKKAAAPKPKALF